MVKFRKKPVVIEAVQLTWGTWSEVCDFVPTPWFVRGCYLDADGKETQNVNGRLGLVMQTRERQEFIAEENDWIIRRAGGVSWAEDEFWRYKPDIFAQRYEPVRITDEFEVPEMTCETHPGTPWPHEDCAGPGMPWSALAGKVQYIHRETERIQRLHRALEQAWARIPYGEKPAPTCVQCVEAGRDLCLGHTESAPSL